jgi:hypothetical protein
MDRVTFLSRCLAGLLMARALDRVADDPTGFDEIDLDLGPLSKDEGGPQTVVLDTDFDATSVEFGAVDRAIPIRMRRTEFHPNSRRMVEADRAELRQAARSVRERLERDLGL